MIFGLIYINSPLHYYIIYLNTVKRGDGKHIQLEKTIAIIFTIIAIIFKKKAIIIPYSIFFMYFCSRCRYA